MLIRNDNFPTNDFDTNQFVKKTGKTFRADLQPFRKSELSVDSTDVGNTFHNKFQNSISRVNILNNEVIRVHLCGVTVIHRERECDLLNTDSCLATFMYQVLAKQSEGVFITFPVVMNAGITKIN